MLGDFSLINSNLCNKKKKFYKVRIKTTIVLAKSY